MSPAISFEKTPRDKRETDLDGSEARKNNFRAFSGRNASAKVLKWPLLLFNNCTCANNGFIDEKKIMLMTVRTWLGMKLGILSKYDSFFFQGFVTADINSEWVYRVDSTPSCTAITLVCTSRLFLRSSFQSTRDVEKIKNLEVCRHLREILALSRNFKFLCSCAHNVRSAAKAS